MDLNILDFAVRGSTLGTILILTVLIWLSRIAREAQFAWTLLAIASTAKSWSHLVENAGASANCLGAENYRNAWCFGHHVVCAHDLS